MAIHQLRIYRIDPDKREAFHARFRDHAMRILETYDFKFVDSWESENDDGLEFIYLLEWPDHDTMTRQWELFMADEEWAATKMRVRAEIGGEPVLQVTSKVLTSTSYGPHFATRTG